MKLQDRTFPPHYIKPWQNKLFVCSFIRNIIILIIIIIHRAHIHHTVWAIKYAINYLFWIWERAHICSHQSSQKNTLRADKRNSCVRAFNTGSAMDPINHSANTSTYIENHVDSTKFPFIAFILLNYKTFII